MMTPHELQQKLRTDLGLRVGDHTARYIAARLASAKPKPFPVLANDAQANPHDLAELVIRARLSVRPPGT